MIKFCLYSYSQILQYGCHMTLQAKSLLCTYVVQRKNIYVYSTRDVLLFKAQVHVILWRNGKYHLIFFKLVYDLAKYMYNTSVIHLRMVTGLGVWKVWCSNSYNIIITYDTSTGLDTFISNKWMKLKAKSINHLALPMKYFSKWAFCISFPQYPFEFQIFVL